MEQLRNKWMKEKLEEGKKNNIAGKTLGEEKRLKSEDKRRGRKNVEKGGKRGER